MALTSITSGRVPLFLHHRVDEGIPVNPTGIGRTVALDLPADRCVVAPQPAADFPKAVLGHPQMADDIAFVGCKMILGHDGFLSGALVARTSNSTRNPIMSCFLARFAGGALTS